MGKDSPYIGELDEAIDKAKKAILKSNFEEAAAWQRQIEVLAPLVDATTPEGAGTGPIPLLEEAFPVVELPLGDDDFVSEGQRRRAEAQARAAERQRR